MAWYIVYPYLSKGLEHIIFSLAPGFRKSGPMGEVSRDCYDMYGPDSGVPEKQEK